MNLEIKYLNLDNWILWPWSEDVRREHTGDAKLEAAEIVRDGVVIANHERGETRRVEMLC